MGERVLLAGCGDLGLRVAQRLLGRGDQVWGLRRHPPVDGPEGLRWLRADLTAPSSLSDLPHGITQLVYLPTPDRRDACAYGAIFVAGLQQVLAAVDRSALRRVLLVSSSAVYGDHGGAWVDEATPTAPLGFRGSLLRDAEDWLTAQALSAVVLRLAGLYGPGRLQLAERLRSGRVTVPRHLVHWSNRMQVDDAAAAIVHLLGLPQVQALYLGVDDTPLPMAELYDHVARLVGASLPADGPAPEGIGSKRLSNARLRASGFVPQWPDARAGYAALLGG